MDRKGLAGEVSGAERTSLGEGQWAEKGLAWVRPVEQGKEADNMSPGGTTLGAPTCKAETQGWGVQSLAGNLPGRRKGKDQEKLDILSIGE